MSWGGGSRRREEEEASIRMSCSSRAAEHAPPGSEGLFFLPYLTGERCPHPDPFARGGWIGLTSRTTRDMLIRSLMEGVTFGMRDALEIMRQMGIPVTEVRAQRRRGTQRILAASCRPTSTAPVVLTNATEGPAYGVALLAGVGIRGLEQRGGSLQGQHQANREDPTQSKIRRDVRSVLWRLRKALF